MGLKAVVGFAFAHVIAFALGVWCFVEMEHQTASMGLALRILLVYDAVLFLCYIGFIIVFLLIKRKKNSAVMMISSSGGSSLDLEEK